VYQRRKHCGCLSATAAQARNQQPVQRKDQAQQSPEQPHGNGQAADARAAILHPPACSTCSACYAR